MPLRYVNNSILFCPIFLQRGYEYMLVYRTSDPEHQPIKRRKEKEKLFDMKRITERKDNVDSLNKIQMNEH